MLGHKESGYFGAIDIPAAGMAGKRNQLRRVTGLGGPLRVMFTPRSRRDGRVVLQLEVWSAGNRVGTKRTILAPGQYEAFVADPSAFLFGFGASIRAGAQSSGRGRRRRMMAGMDGKGGKGRKRSRRQRRRARRRRLGRGAQALGRSAARAGRVAQDVGGLVEDVGQFVDRNVGPGRDGTPSRDDRYDLPPPSRAAEGGSDTSKYLIAAGALAAAAVAFT